MKRQEINKLIGEVERAMFESSIDFPQAGLPKEIWDKDGDSYVLKPSAESKIKSALKLYKDVDLEGLAKEIHVVGSLGTNQWQEDSDLDVHIVPAEDKIEGDPEALQRAVRQFYAGIKGDAARMVDKHPIEVYIQLNPTQEMVGDALYNMTTKEWHKGPTEVDKDFNPYDEYKGILDTIRDVVGDTDKAMGELKRDVIDYDVIKNAISKMPKETKAKLKETLQAKLAEIETDIEELMKDKKEWAERRKQSSVPTTPEQALDDLEYIKKWKDENAIFKFLNRYQYMRLIGDMEEMMKDGEGIDDDDVKKLKTMLGVDKTKGADDEQED